MTRYFCRGELGIGVHSHNFKGIDLFPDAHHSNLACYLCSGFCCNHGGSDNGGQFPDTSEGNKHSNEPLTTKGSKRGVAHDGEVGPNKEVDHKEDGETSYANVSCCFADGLPGNNTPQNVRPG